MAKSTAEARLDPEKQECLGQFGYGTGWFAQETHEGRRPPYCGGCALKTPCWQALKDATPAGQAVLDRYALEAAMRGLTVGAIAQEHAASGQIDPYTRAMLDNIQRGLDERPRPIGILSAKGK